MKPARGSDRRRAEMGLRSTTGSPVKNRDRRNGERRKSVRLYYPATAAPKVLNANFRIINISREAVGFVCQGSCEECTQPINLKCVVDLKVEFHNGETLDLKAAIIRCRRDLDWGEHYYAGILEKPLSAELIGKEQAYLLRHYPDFCRFSRAASVTHMETPLYFEEHTEDTATRSVD